MATNDTSERRPSIEPLAPGIKSIQPGGGMCMRIELAWGYWRRWYLKTFRPRYVADMLAKREGDENACPHEVLDPRDVKFYRNQGGYCWSSENDPFRWRANLPFVRAGLAELIILGGSLFLFAAILGGMYWPFAIPFVVAGMFVGWFFRNPTRRIPEGAGAVVSPADGKVVTIEDVPDDFIGRPAVSIGIFLSVFNVHINRAPMEGTVVGLRYRPGKFLNALRSESARENEHMEIRLEQASPPYRRLVVRQIAGAIARRIVCEVAPGDFVERGEAFGMIKLGSRTELIVPKEEGLEILVSVGQTVKAGATLLAKYSEDGEMALSAGATVEES